MDVFGAHWEHHAERIATAWRDTIEATDTILIPGDISWAMNLPEASADLDYIAALPGRKILIRGNHDYWWHAIGKVRSRLHPSVMALQNDAVTVDGVSVCGTRGWLVPGHPKFTDDDEKIYRREVERLRLSLRAGAASGLPLVVMLHYPPAGSASEDTLFTQLLEEYSVTLCVYGHLHGASHRFRIEGEHNGVRYQLVSADFIAFQPVPITV